MDIKPLHLGNCHGGAVQFEIELPNGLDQLQRCNCFMCRPRGTIVGSELARYLEIAALAA